ncbi:MAG: hypothetical protein IJD91_06460 [Clostridia bacterium]|nr:hypothetical protein [Clostridia bacterium]
MKKVKFIALLLAVVMVFSVLPFSAVAADGKIVIYVSANAGEEGTGSEKAPFKTIARAQQYLRGIDHKNKTVEVLIHAGTYPQEDTLVFTAEDSGSKNNPVIYRAAGDGEVLVSNYTKLNIKDFAPLSDAEILQRISPESRDKVMVLDLEGYNLDMAMFDVAVRTTDPREHQMYPFIHLNGKMQEIAKWPNVGFVDIITVVQPGENVSGGDKGKKGIWKYDSLRPERWGKADQAIVRGYLGTEYAKDSVKLGGVNAQKKEIYLAKASIYGVKPGHRWYIENLLEEIDSPGEYFVDVNTKKLYYYPPYELKETDILEVSTHSKTYIKTDGASYITFDGISVSGNVSGYGYSIYKSNNITVRNATMSNLHQAVYAKDSKNTLVEACTIYDINVSAINYQGGGDIETLTPGNNRVSNCHFYRWGLGGWMQSKVAIILGRGSVNTTIGDVVENNVIHGQPNGQGIFYGGVENIFRYNEIYSLSNDTADMGVIYEGRSLREPGNTISYNYLHDFAPIFDARYNVQGIYWDDWQSGQIAHHNIIVPGGKNSTSGNLFVGADSYYCENIIVNSNTGVHAVDRNSKIHETAYKSVDAGVSAALLEKYPAIATYKPQLDKDDMYLLMKGNVFENNLSVDVNRNNISQVAIDNGSVKNNRISDDYGVFVDSANHDYRLKREYVREFGFPDTFLNEDNFSMDKIGFQPEIMKVEKPETPFRLLYPTNGQMDVIRNTAYIKWEEARYADIYEYVVATDPELKNVVASGKSLYNVVELPDLKNDTVYYYKVWAINQGRQLGNKWASEGETYMFRTTAEDVLEKGLLNEEIKNVEALKETVSANIGDGLGQYSADSLAQIDTILSNAKDIYDSKTGSQEEIQETVTRLQNLQSGVFGYKNKGHGALNVGGEWLTSDDTIAVTNTDGTVNIESHGNGWAYLDDINPGYLSKHFKMKINFNGWTGISLKQNDPSVISYNKAVRNYLIVIKPTQIEFQKYNPAATKTGIMATYPNDYIKENEWVDIEMGCVDMPDGVNVFLKVNGNTVFNELDTEAPNFGDGYMVVRPGSDGACVAFKGADSIPAGEFVYEGDKMGKAKTIYNPDSKIAEKTGIWTVTGNTTADGSYIKVSEDADASLTYTVTDTEVPYMTYYYHEPIENGDKSATISVVAYSPTTGGKTEVVKTVDFSQGKKGWVYLGAYECASFSRTGDIVVTIKGSGEGTLVAPVIGVVKTDKELLEFNRTFYDYSDNLLLLKVDSQKAYNVTEELEIPDVAPYIENDRTMIPLRFVSEAFGAQVEWDEETYTATITSGDKVVSFKIGEKNYTANGEVKESEAEIKLVNNRTMIPLRATAEALGKKVMWYEDGRLIFIADNIGFTETDTTKLQNVAKGFEIGYN